MTQSIMKILNKLATENTYYTLCGQQVHSQPQALSGKCVRASLSGHSSQVALCSLAFPQAGPIGPEQYCHHHPVVCVSATLVGTECGFARCMRPPRGARGLSAVVLTLPSKAGAGISQCCVVVSPALRAFPRGHGSVLIFRP